MSKFKKTVKVRERKKGKYPAVAVAAYLPKPLYDRLKKRAERDARMISGMIEKALVIYLDKLDEVDPVN